jgi:hypothetical protein
LVDIPSGSEITWDYETTEYVSITATNDVGIASSPDGKRVAIAVFIAGSKAPLEEREKVMSDIASAVVKAMQ